MLVITDDNFKDVVDNTDLLVIDFYADWCKPCKAMSKVIEEIDQKYTERLTVGTVDIESCNEVVSEYGIRNLPTLLFIKNKEVVDKIVGATPIHVVEDKINKLIKNGTEN